MNRFSRILILSATVCFGFGATAFASTHDPKCSVTFITKQRDERDSLTVNIPKVECRGPYCAKYTDKTGLFEASIWVEKGNGPHDVWQSAISVKNQAPVFSAGHMYDSYPGLYLEYGITSMSRRADAQTLFKTAGRRGHWDQPDLSLRQARSS